MPAAEIAAAVTGLRSALDITKAMIGLRDAEAFRAKSIELQGIILETMGQAIEARETYATQVDRIRTLEAEVTDLKAWGGKKDKYELKPNYTGAVAYMLKPDARDAEPPHWLAEIAMRTARKAFSCRRSAATICAGFVVNARPSPLCTVSLSGMTKDRYPVANGVAVFGLANSRFRPLPILVSITLLASCIGFSALIVCKIKNKPRIALDYR
jgi:hypothetical protein